MTDALPLAAVEDLAARLDFDIDDPGMTRIAESALVDASEWARYYGSPLWRGPESCPPLARTIVLRACKRYMENPNGYVQSRAGDETVAWAEGDVLGEVEFDEEEKATLADLAGRSRNRGFFGSAMLVAYDSTPPRPRPSHVPVETGGWFPFYSSATDPW